MRWADRTDAALLTLPANERKESWMQREMVIVKGDYTALKIHEVHRKN